MIAARAAAVVVTALLVTGCATQQGVASGTPASASLAPAPATTNPTTSPTVVPSPAASAGVTDFPGYGVHVAPGTYVWSAGPTTPADITFMLPAGWISRFGVAHKDRDGPAEMAFGNWIIGNVYSDPCRWKGSLLSPAVGPTVDDLASALGAQKGRNATAPTDTTLGGYPAKRIELSVPAGLDPATCDEGVMRTWVDPGDPGDKWFSDEPEARGLRSGQLNVVYIVDVDGDRLIIDTWHMPGTSAADLAELEQILASIRIEP